MLAKANRITAASDYKAVVRKGTRFSAPNTVTYVRRTSDERAARFGFIVAKTVGIANRRNRVRRRLKAACYEMITKAPQGTDVVIRALPGADAASWAALHAEVERALDRVASR